VKKGLQDRRNTFKRVMDAMGTNMQQGRQAINNLHQNIESNLALAERSDGVETGRRA
jgi:hypothetical protein